MNHLEPEAFCQYSRMALHMLEAVWDIKQSIATGTAYELRSIMVRAYAVMNAGEGLWDSAVRITEAGGIGLEKQLDHFRCAVEQIAFRSDCWAGRSRWKIDSKYGLVFAVDRL